MTPAPSHAGSWHSGSWHSGSWHAGPELLARYAAGALDDPTEASVETHLVGCSSCQAAANELAQAGPVTQAGPVAPAGPVAQAGPVAPAGPAGGVDLESVWAGVAATIAEPPMPFGLRALRRLGLPDSDAVVLRASSALYRPWVLSVGGALICAVLGGLLGGTEQRLSLLLLAPLVPVAAVVAAFDATDPMRELAAATPLSKLRIALLRTAAATAVAVPVTFAAGVLIPGISQAAAWLLPSLALTLSALVLLTWWSARAAGGAVAGAWVAFVVLVAAADTPTAIGSAAVQAAVAVAALAAAAVLAVRLGSARSPGGFA